MTNRTISTFLVAAVLSVSGAAVFAQSSASSVADRYIITARAGGVNYIEGSVAVARADGKGGLLMRGDRLETGDRVTTSSSARAEVLLNPGSYLRAGGDSEFEFITTDLDDLQIKISKGTAVFEVFADNDFRVTVKTDQGQVAMVTSGVYRIDVNADGTGRVAVVEGRAEVGANAVLVKEGQITSINGAGTIAKFDKKDIDELDVWSRSRAKELAKSTASLKQKDIRSVLAGTLRSGRWNPYDSFGLWIFNPRYGTYSFLPFGNRWSSPYGYGFGYGMDWRSFYWYNPPPPPKYTPPGTVVGGGGSKVRRQPPPFVNVDKESGRRSGADNSGGGFRAPRGDSGPVFSPPTPAPAPVQRIEPQGLPAQKAKPID